MASGSPPRSRSSDNKAVLAKPRLAPFTLFPLLKTSIPRTLAFCATWLLLPALWLFTVTGFAGSLWYYADLFAHFRVQLLCGALGLALIFGLRRKMIVTILAFAAALLNLAVLAPRFASEPALQPTQAAGRTLRCVSFNVLQGNQESAKLERFIRESQADVLVFQEVTPTLAEVLRRVADIYPGQLVLGKKDSKGAALLTRLPARNLRFEPFTDGVIGAVRGEINTGEQWVTVLGIHSHKPTSSKNAQAQREYFQWLAALGNDAEKSGPVVLMGDFNSTPWSSGYRHFATNSRLLDTSHGVVFGATWSVNSPQRLLIDHGFISPGIALLDRTVGADLGSDHRPLILDLRLPAK